MHTKRLLPLLAALFALAGGTAQAQTAMAPQAADSVRVTSGTYYHVTAKEAFDIEQQYRLSNGQRLEVHQQDTHFFGRLIDDREWQAKPSVEIYPTGPGQFVTKQGSTFVFGNEGERVVIDDAQFLPGLRMPADMRSASTVSGSASIRLVSR
jgi:Ni/Co efflux regulator RcnB